MPLHTKARTKRQRAHMASRSDSHIADKVANDKRRELVYVAIPTLPRPGPKRDWPIPGWEATFDGARWTKCQEPKHELIDYLEKETGARLHYYDYTIRRGKRTRVKRKDASPVEILTFQFSPPANEFFASELAAGRNPRPALTEITKRFLS